MVAAFCLRLWTASRFACLIPLLPPGRLAARHGAVVPPAVARIPDTRWPRAGSVLYQAGLAKHTTTTWPWAFPPVLPVDLRGPRLVATQRDILPPQRFTPVVRTALPGGCAFFAGYLTRTTPHG